MLGGAPKAHDVLTEERLFQFQLRQGITTLQLVALTS
jgi:hypothetical protein